MHALIAAALFAAISTPDACVSTAYPDAEANELLASVKEVLPARLRDTDFETLNIGKCRRTFQDHRGRMLQIVELQLDAKFQNRSTVPDATIRDLVHCTLVREAVFDEPQEFKKRCYRFVEILLSFNGIPAQVTVADSEEHIDFARQYLVYLSRQVGSVIDGELFSSEEFQRLSRIRISRYGSRRHAYASYNFGDCRSNSIRATAMGENVLEFSDLERQNTVC